MPSLVPLRVASFGLALDMANGSRSRLQERVASDVLTRLLTDEALNRQVRDLLKAEQKEQDKKQKDLEILQKKQEEAQKKRLEEELQANETTPDALHQKPRRRSSRRRGTKARKAAGRGRGRGRGQHRRRHQRVAGGGAESEGRSVPQTYQTINRSNTIVPSFTSGTKIRNGHRNMRRESRFVHSPCITRGLG